jgi:hypothetical protein
VTLAFLISAVISIVLAIHAVRTGQNLYWLFILFLFPPISWVVYIVAVYLPASRLPHSLQSATVSAARSLDPGRELREARAAFSLTPTAQNRLRVAAALMQSGDYAGALVEYDQCLSGPLGHDPEIRLAAARARLANLEPRQAEELLEAIRRDRPEFRVEEITLALAQCHAAQGNVAAAREQFEFATSRFGSVEARVEYAIWAHSQGDNATAARLKSDLEDTVRHWNRHTRDLNRPLIDRLNAAFAAAR